MKQNNKLVVALLIAGVTSAVFPATTSFADEDSVCLLYTSPSPRD